MTDNDKMREEFEDWYMRIHPHIHYMVRTPTDGYANRHAQELWGIWQAAKSVPVVGAPVAYTYPEEIEAGESSARAARTGEIGVWHISKQPQCPDDALMLYLKPTTSITEAELERLRKDAERWRIVKQNGYVTEDAIDAAIAAEGEKK